MSEAKKILYTDLSQVINDYDDGIANEYDLYDMLFKIQYRWENVFNQDGKE